MTLPPYTTQIPEGRRAFSGLFKTAWLSSLVLILVGCNSLTPPQGKPAGFDPGIHQNLPALGQQTQADDRDPYQPLLDLADHALKRQHFTQPAATSALTYFNLILITDSEHQAAKAGLKTIIDQYLEWALRAIEAANYAEANQFLERAARVDPKSSDITAMADRLRRKREEGRLTEIVPAWLLAARSETLQSTAENAHVNTYLRNLAQKIESLDAKITIYSANDAEGRWLYRKLNADTVNRLRGTLKIDSPSRIEMHFASNPSTLPAPKPPSGLVDHYEEPF